MNISITDANTNIKIYITMEKITKQLIKEAILEALVEFTNGGVAMTSEGEGEGEGSQEGSTEGSTGGKDPNKGGNSAENSGGGLNNGKPKPNAGVGVWSRR